MVRNVSKNSEFIPCVGTERLEIHRPSTCCQAINIARFRNGAARNTPAFDVVLGAVRHGWKRLNMFRGTVCGVLPLCSLKGKKKTCPRFEWTARNPCVARNSLGLLEPFKIASDSTQASSAGPGFLVQNWFRTDLFPAMQNGPTAEPNPSHTCLSRLWRVAGKWRGSSGTRKPIAEGRIQPVCATAVRLILSAKNTGGKTCRIRQ